MTAEELEAFEAEINAFVGQVAYDLARVHVVFAVVPKE